MRIYESKFSIKKGFIVILLIFIFSIVYSVNPSSTNYILQQSAFASGNNAGNQPTSTNYSISGSAIGVISGEDAGSSNYNQKVGYYLGQISFGILPPENVVITISGGNVNLSWDAVNGADSYKVYSSNDPNLAAGSWTLEQGNISGTTWSEAVPAGKKFYYVTAVKGTTMAKTAR